MITLEENYSNEGFIADERQLLMLLPNHCSTDRTSRVNVAKPAYSVRQRARTTDYIIGLLFSDSNSLKSALRAAGRNLRLSLRRC